ncbi:MAG: hypothetical protein M3R69_15235 [Acidobacteriota bacterium]|nr:hypothetical protein [Acidobacteriota bacterium]
MQFIPNSPIPPSGMISRTLLTIANYSTLWDVGRTASACSNRGAKQADQYSMPTVVHAVVVATIAGQFDQSGVGVYYGTERGSAGCQAQL